MEINLAEFKQKAIQRKRWKRSTNSFTFIGVWLNSEDWRNNSLHKGKQQVKREFLEEAAGIVEQFKRFVK